MDMSMDGYLRFILALIFVIGLIAVFAALARRAGWGFPAAAIKRSANRRLGVVEVTPLDGRRRLLLVRRDDTEHLLLIGPTSELLIEAGITGADGGFKTALDKATALPPADAPPEPQS